jgi:hypothetical protein
MKLSSRSIKTDTPVFFYTNTNFNPGKTSLARLVRAQQLLAKFQQSMFKKVEGSIVGGLLVLVLLKVSGQGLSLIRIIQNMLKRKFTTLIKINKRGFQNEKYYFFNTFFTLC